MQIAVPTVNEGAEISYKLTDANGNEIPVENGKWIPSVAGVYTITYTATKCEHVATATTTVTVADKPVITLNGENVTVATVGDEITVATATAKDFFNEDLTVVITVTDANAQEVVLSDGKFIANVIGEYTVKYSVEDAHGNANEIQNVIECKPEPLSKGEVPAGVVNSFETEEECRIAENTANSGGYTLTHNSTNDNADGVRSGAYSLKVENSGSKNFNLVAETILGTKDLSEVGKISFWIYNPKETAQGMSIYGIVFTDGSSVKTEVYKSIPAKSWWEFSYNYTTNEAITEEKLESVFSIQFWGIKEVYIDDISVVYRKDIKPAEPANTAISFEGFGAAFTATNIAMNTDPQYVIDGSLSLQMTLVNSGEWSVARYSRWGKGIRFTEDYNAITMQVYASKAVRVTFLVGAGGNSGGASYLGFSNTKAYALEEGWNEVTINFDTDITEKTAPIKEGIVYFGAQAVIDSYEGPGSLTNMIVNNSGAVLYVDAVLAVNVETPDPTPPSKGEVPEGVVNSFETEEECRIAENTANSGGYTVTHNSTNENADGVRSGAYSLKVENSGSKNFNLVAETILGTKDLSEVGKISFWIYNPKETAQGMSIYGIVFTDGSSVKTEVYKSIPAKSWWEFSYNYTTNEAITEEKLESVFSIQFWGIKEVYIDDISVVYRKDIKPAEPANTAISFEGFGAAFTATNIAMNTDPQYVIDGSLSLQMTLVNSGEWSVARYSRWGKGIRFTEDYNAITMQVYASKAVRVTFLVGAGGNSGGASYLGFSNTKAYALEEGWNEVTINFDTDITEKTAPIKEGIVYFGAQAVIDSYEGPGSLTNMIVNNSGAVLYVDAVLAVNVETPDPTPPSKGEVPEGVVNSFETEEECRISENTANSGGYTLTHNSTNDNADGVRSGAYSLHVVNSGSKNFNLVAETILGSQDLSEVAKISFWIYNPLETSQGMSIYRTVLKNGTALKTEVYKSIPAKSWWEFAYDYSANGEITREQLASVFSIQFWGIKEVYIDDISVVYREKVVVDFESFTEIASGAASSASGGAGISLNTDAAKAKSGNNSIKIVANQSCQVHVKPAGIFGFQDLSAYTAVELYVYCDTAKAFNLMAFLPGSGGSINHAINTTLKAGEWNKITIDLTNEVFTTYNIWSFKFWMSGGEGIVFYVDDITLIPA